MTPLADDFSFRAVAALLPPTPSQPGDSEGWKLRRSLFDRGLVCIGSVPVAGSKALCFLAGDAVRSLDGLDVESRGHITMSGLTEYGLFANQLFRYACVKMYALRHGLTPAFPEWQGNQLYGLEDKPCAGLTFPSLSYGAFAKNERELWDKDDPPIDIDLVGYFQEIPECWRRQRPLLRRLFALVPEYLHAIEAWHREVTDGGRRTLVAVHVRRGDYRNLQNKNAPWFRIVPEDWYLDWLRAVWPTLREPLLFVGTDEPDAIRPVFQEFEMVAATFDSMPKALPEYVRDFEILRRADYLAICNSSFSHMAAVLGPSTQKCFLPSFQAQGFVPYEPWIDPGFWVRFEESWRRLEPPGNKLLAPVVSPEQSPDPSPEEATIFFDVSDLLLYLLHQSTLSGIQRVQCEFLHHLFDTPLPQPVRFVVLNKRGGLCAIETPALLNVIEDIRSHAAARADIESELHELLDRAVPCTIRSREVFLSIGAFWNVSGMGILLQNLKNSGVIIGVFIHDIIPIAAREYFEAASTSMFVKSVVEALTFADFILTTSEYNKSTLAKHMASGFDPVPVHLVPLGHEFSLSASSESKISSVVADILDTEYVLCVGTIEVRKNPTYLFNIWKMMVRSGRSSIPYLVFAGRRGWLVQDFMQQLKGCDYLAGRIVVVTDATDAELNLLYRNCMLTVFPSFVEGWGLPVGESLAHGKVCLCSDGGGIPEVGGKLVDYIDPYNTRDGLEHLLRYLDNPELRRSREREIAESFEPRSWRQATDNFLRSTHALARQAQPLERAAAILLPPGRFLPISRDAPAVLMDEVDGRLSAELICVSGWLPPEILGVRASQPTAAIRFRTARPAGTRINLILRLAAYGRDCRIRIRSGSGAETEVLVSSAVEKMAVLSCAIEPGELVNVHLLLIGATLVGDESSDASCWMLKGILYFDPKQATAKPSNLKDVPARLPATAPSPPRPVDRPESTSRRDRIALRSKAMDESRRAGSFGAFLQMTDCYWPSESSTDFEEPIFADRADRRAFSSGCGNRDRAPQVGKVIDSVKLTRRSNQFVSMSRFSEGSVFDRSGVWREWGYLEGAPPAHTPWLSNGADGLWADEESLAAAPFFEGSYLIFYNGNLHNYYHWLVEGLLSLDVSSQALGFDSNLKIVLPKSMDINALLDHRESLRAIGFGGRDIAETSANLIRVQEAIWVDSDLVETMPAPYLKDFQQRVAALYAGDAYNPPVRRLLVARKGPTRTIYNIKQLQAYLSRYDFETVYLEGMSMADQIRLFQGAAFIISPHGAGLANLLFCRPGTRVIELMPSVDVRPFFWLISQKLDLVHGMQFCATVGPDFQSAITVDIAKLQTLIQMVDAHF